MNTFTVKIGDNDLLTLEYSRKPGEDYVGERIIEVPIAVHFIKRWQQEGANIVEVGNVLTQWLDRYDMTCTWPVWDLFDAGPGVKQKDVTDGDYRGLNVLCVSTVEHVGRPDYGNTNVDWNKCNVAFDKIASEANEFLITIPIGYNAIIDRHAAESELPCFILRQLKPAEIFEQIDVTSEAWASKYEEHAIAFIYGTVGWP